MAGTGYRTPTDFEVRPAEPADADAIGRVAKAAFDVFAPETTVETTIDRARHLLVDAHPSSAVAAAGDAMIGVTLARQIGPVVYLAWAAVAEAHQGRGVMRALLERFPTVDEASQRVIMSSTDPKAVRRYLDLGLRLHPAMAAAGILRPGAVVSPSEAVEQSPLEAADVIESIALTVRRAPYGRDLQRLETEGSRAHVIGREAVCLRRDGTIRFLVARNEQSAALALRAALAAVPPGHTVHVQPLRAGQDWAIRELSDAGLELSPEGPLFSDHPLSPLHIPNGSFF